MRCVHFLCGDDGAPDDAAVVGVVDYVDHDAIACLSCFRHFPSLRFHKSQMHPIVANVVQRTTSGCCARRALDHHPALDAYNPPLAHQFDLGPYLRAAQKA